MKTNLINYGISHKMPAGNGQFGAMAALAPQKRQCGLGSYYPAGSVVEAATASSRWDVSCHPRDSAAVIGKLTIRKVIIFLK